MGRNTEDKVGKLKNYLIYGLFITVGILLLLQQCNAPKSSKNDLKSDTVHIVSYDTINRPYEVIKFKPIYKPVYDTIRDIIPGEVNQDSLFYARIYNDSLTDSNLTIFTRAKTYGILDGLQVNYRLKVPLMIVKNDNTVITNTITEVKPNKWSLYVGGEIGGSKTSFNMSPYVGLRIKRVAYQYRYGVIDQTHNVGISYTILNSRK